MSVRRWREGTTHRFAARLRDRDATYAGHPIGWGDEGVAPRPEYPIRVVARKGESLVFALQGRILRTEAAAVAFVQRCRNDCVLLDARDRFVGSVFRSRSGGGWTRCILLEKENENVHVV